MKYEPENKNFNYNEYIHRLGGRKYFHPEELSAAEIKSKYKGFQIDGQFVATERIDIYNLNKEDNIYKKLKGHIIICRRYVQGILGGNKYPKKLGKHKGKFVYLNSGPYGYYLTYGKKNYKIKSSTEIKLDDAIKLIK